jgi:hypothetical protein
VTAEIEDEFKDVLGALKGATQTEIPAGLRGEVLAIPATDELPAAPWAAFEEHADDIFTYVCALTDGDSWLAEQLLTEAFSRVGTKSEPTFPELIQAARHAALEALAKSGSTRPEGALSTSDRALVFERRLGLSLEDLARSWSQMPARLTERLSESGARLLDALEEHTNRPAACPEWRARLPKALLGVLADDDAEAYAIHRTECPACAGLCELLETTMHPTQKTLPAPEKTRKRLEERIDPGAGPTAEELGIQVAVSCCYCHDRMGRKEAAFCSTCLAPHHPDCFEEHARCATPGCVGTEVVYPSARREPERVNLFSRFKASPIAVLLLTAVAAFGGADVYNTLNTVPNEEAAFADLVEPVGLVSVAGESLSGSPTPLTKPAVKDVHELVTLQEDPLLLEVPAGSHTLSELFDRWCAAHGLSGSTDKQVEMLKVDFPTARSLDRVQFRALLEAQDVVLVVGEGKTANIYHRRNLATKVSDSLLVEGDTAVDPDRFISRVIRIRHGDGSTIFATVRGLLTRDTNRIGNILFVTEPQLITVVDLARKVRYYEEMITQLDRPQSHRPRARVEIFQVGAADWATLRDKPSAVALFGITRLVAKDEAFLLESSDLDYSDRLPTERTAIFKRVVNVQAHTKAELSLEAIPEARDNTVTLLFSAKAGADVSSEMRVNLPVKQVSVQAIYLAEKNYLIMAVSNN